MGGLLRAEEAFSDGADLGTGFVFMGESVALPPNATDNGAMPNICSSPLSEAEEVVRDWQAYTKMLRSQLTKAQHRIKTQVDKHRCEQQFQVGDRVLLKLQPYAQHLVVNRPYPKLAFKYFGPFVVLEKIGVVAYKLQLPTDSLVHPVFHVYQLKPFTPNYTPVFF